MNNNHQDDKKQHASGLENLVEIDKHEIYDHLREKNQSWSTQTFSIFMGFSYTKYMDGYGRKIKIMEKGEGKTARRTYK